MSTNVTAPFCLIREFLPELKAARGSIVNVSSIHANLTKPGFVAYATSKVSLKIQDS
jgi:NAD(P)-dependent dehydrogenase (short-subunit alcohol dehydrogenase family)